MQCCFTSSTTQTAMANGHVGTNNRADNRWHGGFGYSNRNEQDDEIVQLAKSHNITTTVAVMQKRKSTTIYSNEIRKIVKDCKEIPVKDQNRLSLSEIRLLTLKQTKDTAVKMSKICWHKAKDPEGEPFLMAMEEMMQDVVNKEDVVDTNEM